MTTPPKAVVGGQQRYLKEQPLHPSDIGIGLLFEVIHEAAIVADTAADKILLWNPAAQRMFGYTKEEAFITPLRALVPPDLREQHLSAIKRFNEKGTGPLIESSTPIELTALHKDGSEIFVELSLTTLAGTGAPSSWVLGLIRDVRGRRDFLTGLWNRRRFEEEVTRHLLEAQRYDLIGSFLFIDIDRLKYVNDTYGHHVGDEALKRLAHVLKRRFRVTDPVGRWGGDEFAVLLPRVPHERADEIARLLAASLADKPLTIGHEVLRTSASMGVSSYGGESTSIDDLVLRADRAMYIAKRAKRDTRC